jgi:glutathione synthase/RimK-type ligase-like ATP-grasp enzyme
MRVAIASFAAMPPEFRDNQQIAAALIAQGVDVSIVSWDDRAADWAGFDAVVIRTTWDYTERRDEFVAWTESIGARLHNSPALVRWNSDKHYLADLAAAGISVVETAFAEPGDEPPALAGEVVVKPTVSVGAKHSGRFSERTHDEAFALIDSIHRSGRAAMIQPYVDAVDTAGETAIVFLDGEPSHVLRKRAVLRPDEVAPMREGGAAEVMYDPELVTASEATGEEFAFARKVIAHVSERFGYVPLYGRVDMVTGSDGSPTLMELEVIEPNLYLDQAPGAVDRVAAAIVARG